MLRVVPHSNLAILDPIWTTAYMSRNHGYMIYDTLFGTDEKNEIKPQMVETWTVSPDNRLWTFKLREGPGVPRRQAGDRRRRDRLARALGQARRDGHGADGVRRPHGLGRRRTPSASSSRACGFVLEALGKPSSNVPFIMPKRVAETDAFKQIEDYTGSGPYIFKRTSSSPATRRCT